MAGCTRIGGRKLQYPLLPAVEFSGDFVDDTEQRVQVCKQFLFASVGAIFYRDPVERIVSAAVPGGTE